jgi:DNA-binding GntR family transcriptional regulator
VTGTSVAELQELYELREAVEPLATQIAVPNVGRADLLTMRKQLQIMEEHTDTATWLAANTNFHAAVYRRADRPRMIELVERLRGLTDRYMYVHLEVIGQTEHLVSEHLSILAAVESGDAALAARLTREHLATSHDFILTYLLQEQDTVLGSTELLPALHARRHFDTGLEAAVPGRGRRSETSS